MFGTSPIVTATLQYIGAATLAYAAYKLFDHVTFYLLPASSLSRYRRNPPSWAVVTGASAGIGLGAAHELAARGFHLVLLGHLPGELDEAAEAIRAESPAVEVRIVVLDAVTATSDAIEEALAFASTLPVTILVNNVGGFPIAQPAIRNVAEYSGAELDRSLNINARFMAHMSRILLPRLASSGPSLMINLSSAAKMGIPGVGPYSGCKGFIISFTTAMAREVAATGQDVDCVAIVPGDVRTQSNQIAVTPGSPDGRQYAKVMLDRAPRAAARGWFECKPWWSHSVTIGILEALPSFAAQHLLLLEFDKKKKAVAQALKQR
ncbi:NAD(P)-binding protein [Xylariaceae sp. FL0016]|nr:NAD(P)-binding protein [Xylariaceae sp. FL0016]